MFVRRPDWARRNGAKGVTIVLDGVPVSAIEGDSVAAAVLSAKPGHTRVTPVRGRPRAPYCMMGVCFECLMEIDDVPNRQACLITVRDGMAVRRQSRLPAIADGEETL